MARFDSAEYLALRHSSSSLRGWSRLTLGTPAALAEPAGTRSICRGLAQLQGLETSLLGTSTMHLFWDLFGVFPAEQHRLHVDSGLYAVGRWGVERAVARGMPARQFPHHDLHALQEQLNAGPSRGRPIVVTDGFCPVCGSASPLAEYLTAVRQFGGFVVVDDSQALGVLGNRPPADGERASPACESYGLGGGGSIRWHGIADRAAADIVVISSLAKGFGAPLAAISGSHERIGSFEEQSATRVHCSPSSIAALRAAEHALHVNRLCGDELRYRLAVRVRQFRSGLACIGLQAINGIFPMQTLLPAPGVSSEEVYRRLRIRGIRAVLQRGHQQVGARLTFVFNAQHQREDINELLDGLNGSLQYDPREGRPIEEIYHASTNSRRTCCSRIPAF